MKQTCTECGAIVVLSGDDKELMQKAFDAHMLNHQSIQERAKKTLTQVSQILGQLQANNGLRGMNGQVLISKGQVRDLLRDVHSLLGVPYEEKDVSSTTKSA